MNSLKTSSIFLILKRCKADDKKEYIAVKSCLMLQAVITASNLNLFSQNFLDNLRDLQSECSH